MARILVWLLGFVLLSAVIGCDSKPPTPASSVGPSRDRPFHLDERGKPTKQPTREVVFPTQPPPRKAK
jgi:hypothetical protein